MNCFDCKNFVRSELIDEEYFTCRCGNRIIYSFDVGSLNDGCPIKDK